MKILWSCPDEWVPLTYIHKCFRQNPGISSAQLQVILSKLVRAEIIEREETKLASAYRAIITKETYLYLQKQKFWERVHLNIHKNLTFSMLRTTRLSEKRIEELRKYIRNSDAEDKEQD